MHILISTLGNQGTEDPHISDLENPSSLKDSLPNNEMEKGT